MVKKALENSEKIFPLPFGSPAIELENVTSGHIRAVLKFADFFSCTKKTAKFRSIKRNSRVQP